MTNDELAKELENTNAKIAELQNRIAQLERDKSFVSLPNTMILDHSFLKRAFAIYGHGFVAGIIITIPIYCLLFFASL